ncbi:MAG: AsmA family protein [Gammaproteobacteria bacterium]
MAGTPPPGGDAVPRRRRRRRQHVPAPQPPPLLPRVPWRRVFAAAALAALALVLVALVLILTVDVDRYRPPLIAAVEAATGRTFVIGGAVRIRPSLSPTLVVEDVRLGNPAWAEARDFLRVERLEAQVRLGALLRHRLEIVRFDLRGAHLALARDGARASWHFDRATGAADDVAGAVLPTFSVEQVRLRDITIDWHGGHGPPRTLRLAALSIDASGPDQPLRLRGEASYDLQRIELGGRFGPLAVLRDAAPYPFELRVNYRDLRLEAAGTLAEPARGRGFDVAFTLEAPALDSLDILLGRRFPALSRPAVRGRLRDDGDTVVIEPFDLDLGPSSATGRLEVRLDGPRPHLHATLASTYFDLDAFGTARGGAGAATAGWRDWPLDPAWLGYADVTLAARLEALRGRAVEFDDIVLAATLADRVLEVSTLTLAIGAGRAEATMHLDARSAPPRVGHRLRLAQVPVSPFVGPAHRHVVRGGTLDLAFDLTASGATPAALASHADGALHARLGDLELADSIASVAEGDLLLGLLDALNPRTDAGERVEVECAVARFPLRDGRFENGTGLGLTTRKLRVLGGGSITLASGALDLGIDARPREGAGLSLAAFSDFIRIGGTLAAPRATTDAAGLASAGVKAGAAVATGGLSLLAEGMLDRAEGEVDVCAIAAGTLAAPGAGVVDRAASAARRALDVTARTLERTGERLRDGVGGLLER